MLVENGSLLFVLTTSFHWLLCFLTANNEGYPTLYSSFLILFSTLANIGKLYCAAGWCISRSLFPRVACGSLHLCFAVCVLQSFCYSPLFISSVRPTATPSYASLPHISTSPRRSSSSPLLYRSARLQILLRVATRAPPPSPGQRRWPAGAATSPWAPYAALIGRSLFWDAPVTTRPRERHGWPWHGHRRRSSAQTLLDL
jgi:hypothetical protein